MITLFPQPDERPQPSDLAPLDPAWLGDPSYPIRAVEAEVRIPPPGRAWLMTNMIASADGATSVGGLSGPLGSKVDQAILQGLRATSDAIIVGSATAIAERYRPPSLPDPITQARRVRLGQASRPTIVVISRSLSFPQDLPLFSQPEYRPIVATTQDADPQRKRDLAKVADIVDAGTNQVEVAALMKILHERGLSVILSEGGPRLNSQLIAAQLVDEWNLTLSPLLASGPSPRPAAGPDPAQPPIGMELKRIWMADNLLFCRWIRTSQL